MRTENLSYVAKSYSGSMDALNERALKPAEVIDFDITLYQGHNYESCNDEIEQVNSNKCRYH